MNVSSDNTLDKLEELCELCLRKEGPGATLLSNLKDSIEDVDPILNTGDTLVDEDLKSNPNIPILRKLFQLLHQCLLNQRWPEALQVFHKVVRVPKDTSTTVWKVGSELLQTEPDKQDVLMKQLYKEAKLLCDLNCKEVALDFVMFLLTRGDNEGARSVIQENILRSNQTEGDREHYISHLHRAYTGLLWYIEWKRIHKQVQQLQENTMNQEFGMFMSPGGSQHLEMQLENYCSKANLCFDAIQGQPGIWDIFINKQVEMLVYHEKIDEALVVLQEYAIQNKTNPNAQKNLYLFYKQHFPNSGNTLTQLKVVAEMIPSDSLVLELCEILKKDGVGLAVPYLFMLLDYPCWQNKETPWRKMADCLEALCVKRKDSRAPVETSWRSRASWWPMYHFTCNQLHGESEAFGVNFYKAVVAVILCGKDNDFVLEAMKRFSEEELEEIKTFRRHCKDGIT